MGTEDEWGLRAKPTIPILLDPVVYFPQKLNNGSKLFAVILRSCWCMIDIFGNFYLDSWFCFKYNHCLPSSPSLTFFFFFCKMFAREKGPCVARSFSNVFLHLQVESTSFGLVPCWWCQDTNFIVTSPIPNSRGSSALIAPVCLFMPWMHERRGET